MFKAIRTDQDSPSDSPISDLGQALRRGVTGSFAKELVRRAVLAAAVEQRPVSDEHLAQVLDEIMQSRQHLTRRMLGATTPGPTPDIDLPHTADESRNVPS